jgi:hypothetical protein
VTEYDRVNPITQDDAMKEWFMEVSKISDPESQGKEGRPENLSAYFQHMPKQNQFSNLTNYAQFNPSFKQVHQMHNNNFQMNFAPRPGPQQQLMFVQPVQMNQPRPMALIPQMPQNRFTAVPNQMIRFTNQQVNRFMPVGMQNAFGFQAPRPAVVSHFPQQTPQQGAIQMPQVQPQVASHFPQPANTQQAAKPQVANHFPQPETANKPSVSSHFPQQQAPTNQPPVIQSQPFQMTQQPQPVMVKPQPQPQSFQMNMPQMMGMGQPQMMQPQGMMPQAGIQMTQQVQPNQFGVQPQFGFQQPQPQFGMQPNMGQPNMGQPNFGMQRPMQQQPNSVFGGQPGFGFKNQGF